MTTVCVEGKKIIFNETLIHCFSLPAFKIFKYK